MHPHVNIAVRAARAAGNLIMRHLNHVDQITVDEKRRNDFVTEVDRAAEDEIIRVIRRAHPDHAILAEESGRQGDDAEHLWIIDPLDGTTNYIHGFPQFSVSIALAIRGRIDHGVVYDPFTQELFTASRGEGAQLDGRRIRVSRTRTLDRSLIGTGFPVRSKARLEAYLPIFKAVLENVSDVRRAGSAALDLAYVAAGRLDGFWEIGLKPWDVAAGTLLITEAGGTASDLDGETDMLKDEVNVIAGNRRVFSALMGVLQNAGADAHRQNTTKAKA